MISVSLFGWSIPAGLILVGAKYVPMLMSELGKMAKELRKDKNTEKTKISLKLNLQKNLESLRNIYLI